MGKILHFGRKVAEICGFSPKTHQKVSFKCKVCGRQLRSQKSIEHGMGAACMERHPAFVMAQLEEAGQQRFSDV